MQVRKLVASAMRDVPGHTWLREADWLALCDRLDVVTLRMAALEVALEGDPSLRQHRLAVCVHLCCRLHVAHAVVFPFYLV